MKLYSYSTAIEQAVAIDPETGEITPESQATLDALEMGRDEKALDICALYKDLEAEAAGQDAFADAIQAVADQHKARAKALRHRTEWLKRYLAQWLPADTKLKDARASLGFKATEALDVEEGADYGAIPARFVDYEPKLRKAEIKTALKAGQTIKHCSIKTNVHAVIK